MSQSLRIVRPVASQSPLGDRMLRVLRTCSNPALVALLAFSMLPPPAAACTERPCVTAAAVPSRGGTSSAPRGGPGTAAQKDPSVLIAGGVVGGVGLLLAAVGFGTFGGVHAGNPGKGLQLAGFDDGGRQRSVTRLARGMQVLGFVGTALVLSGGVLIGVGVPRYRGDAPRRSKVVLAVAPGVGSLSVVGRF